MRLRHTALAALCLLGLGAPVAFAATATPASEGTKIDAAWAARLAALPLECVHKEFPNKIAHYMNSAADARTPSALTPAFYGCLDWHSSVHGHWLLVRLAQLYPDAAFAREARAALAESLTPERIAGEVAYFGRGDKTFERPYGLAWLLQLSAQLRSSSNPQDQAWAAHLAPLEKIAADNIKSWLPKLTRPIRVGEHSQTAFAFGLILDWARQVKDAEMIALVEQRSRDYYGRDVDCPIAYEPSGQDFLSPCLAEADLMRRVMGRAEFSKWLGTALPDIPRSGGDAWLEPGVVLDKSDGKLAHLDGLNLSRAWMLEGIVRGLPANDARIPALKAAASRHRTAGLASIRDMHYMGSHWLGTFATYLLAPPTH